MCHCDNNDHQTLTASVIRMTALCSVNTQYSERIRLLSRNHQKDMRTAAVSVRGCHSETASDPLFLLISHTLWPLRLRILCLICSYQSSKV